MKLEQREPTKSLEERTDSAVEALGSLGHLKGFPETEKAILITAKAIARFAETVEVNHTSEDGPRKTDLGWVVPLDWLIEEVINTCVFFPAPIQLRRIYETRFTPLDGRYSTGMTSVVEG